MEAGFVDEGVSVLKKMDLAYFFEAESADVFLHTEFKRREEARTAPKNKRRLILFFLPYREIHIEVLLKQPNHLNSRVPVLSKFSETNEKKLGVGLSCSLWIFCYCFLNEY